MQDDDRLIDLLKKACGYARQVRDIAESRHDDYDSEYYQDLAQYELMKEADEVASELSAIISTLEAVKLTTGEHEHD